VYVEREAKLAVPVAYGEAVVSAVSRVLDAILATTDRPPA
jgi:hypothetical protein